MSANTNTSIFVIRADTYLCRGGFEDREMAPWLSPQIYVAAFPWLMFNSLRSLLSQIASLVACVCPRNSASQVERATKCLGLTYKGHPLVPKGFTDADWAGCRDARRSTAGYLFNIAARLLLWSLVSVLEIQLHRSRGQRHFGASIAN
jgi:hypothetical protein